jgi:hypothetical protein
MTRTDAGSIQNAPAQVVEGEWVAMPGGELDGRRPSRLCGPCRLRRAAGAQPRAFCFTCYREEALRRRALQAAASLDTGSEERFQSGLPFEPVNGPRLARLKAERLELRQLRVGTARFVDKRRHAQIAARHALQRLGIGLDTRGLHAAELQLPEAWLPFVGSRQG